MIDEYQHYHSLGYEAGYKSYNKENHNMSLAVLHKQANQAASSANVPPTLYSDYRDGFEAGFRDKRRESEGKK